MTFSLTITITDAPGTGLFSWELRDQGHHTRGLAPTISECLIAIARARRAIERYVTGEDPYAPFPSIDCHPSPNPAPIPQDHPPSSDARAPEQDVPSPEFAHPLAPISSHLHPTRFG